MLPTASTTCLPPKKYRLPWRSSRSKRHLASSYIGTFDTLERSDSVLLAMRVSGASQDHSGNLDNQQSLFREVCEKAGVTIVGERRYVGSGFDPSWLRPLAFKAKTLNAVILAVSTDRMIRHPRYHSELAPNRVAGEDEFQLLRFWTLGVPLVTYLHPDTPPKDVESFRVKLGQRMKQRWGGGDRMPGWTKRRRQSQLRNVMQLREAGATVRDIAEQLHLPASTVDRWVLLNS